MNKFDSTLKLPAMYDLVKVYYTELETKLMVVGFWDGGGWYCLSNNEMKFLPKKLNNVYGWEEIKF